MWTPPCCEICKIIPQHPQRVSSLDIWERPLVDKAISIYKQGNVPKIFLSQYEEISDSCTFLLQLEGSKPNMVDSVPILGFQGDGSYEGWAQNLNPLWWARPILWNSSSTTAYCIVLLLKIHSAIKEKYIKYPKDCPNPLCGWVTRFSSNPWFPWFAPEAPLSVFWPKAPDLKRARQHCRFSIRSYFGWGWQILRRAGLSKAGPNCSRGDVAEGPGFPNEYKQLGDARLWGVDG